MICASQEDVQTAVFNAHEAFKAGVWSRAPALQRASVLSNLARDLEAHVPDLAKLETMQTGRAIREMNAQVCLHLLVFQTCRTEALIWGRNDYVGALTLVLGNPPYGPNVEEAKVRPGIFLRSYPRRRLMAGLDGRT